MHPLDPLSADEIRQAVAILRRDRDVGPDWRFASVTLEEPPKAWLQAFSGGPFTRRARAVTWSRTDGTAYVALVDLTDGRVEEFTPRPGVQPNFTPEEYHECDEMLRAHPEVLAALARRGVTDPSLALVDLWAYGDAVVPPQWRDRRVGWCDVWVRSAPGANPYAHFLKGLHVVVDVNAMTVLEIEDDGTTDRPPVMGEYEPELVPGLIQRDDLRPLEITQPEGVSFTVDGNELRWQRWRLRVGFNYREGLVLHQVGYEDGDRVRPIAHRLSFAEMVVPYRDPTADHYRRTAFDIGEWGLGVMTQSLELGCDCLGEIRYLDGVLANGHGEPYEIRNAICLHEEDNAVLWKHVDHHAGAEVRRMRRLVVSCHVTVANYEYLVYWRFYQDGNIECEVRATGIMVTTGLGGADGSPFGTTVDADTYAPHHQHFIVARLDLDIDGGANTVYETHSEVLPVGPDNPYGVGDAHRVDAARHRGRRPSRLRLGVAAGVEDRERRPPQRARRGGGLQAGADRLRAAPAAGGLGGARPGRGDPPPAVGDRARRRRALAVRRVPHAERRRPRSAGVDARRPRTHRHGPGALVRVRHPPHHAGRGLAGDAGRHRLVLAEAVRLLRPQSGARRAAAAGALPRAARALTRARASTGSHAAASTSR